MAQLAHVPSDQQQVIYKEFEEGTGNVVIIARAGVGKTTTAVSGIQFAPERKILFTCFNKKIEIEGNKKLAALGMKDKAKYQTFHSLGCGVVMRFWEGVRVCENFERSNNLTNAVCGGTAPDAIKRLISKLHTLGREILPHARKAEELFDLAVQMECVPDEQWEKDGFDLTFVCRKSVEAMELAASEKPKDGFIDYSDMIFLPVRNKWLSKIYDMVIVDEGQDLTGAKLELSKGVCRGRMMIIGDNMQAIYAFLGASMDMLDQLKLQLDAKELRLTKTFRCGKAIVREAQALVPDFEAADSNHEGEVIDLPVADLVPTAGPGDFILSRLNAPLVSFAMRLLRNGKRTKIAGKNIGKGLIDLIRKFRARSVPDLLTKITNWEKNEQTRLKARYADKLDSPAYTTRSEAITDQSVMLAEITETCKNVDEVTQKILALFTDDGLGDAGVITCSSVHKSKGLEAKRVFVLMDTLRDFNQEELNIKYVAITRAIETLFYVRGL